MATAIRFGVLMFLLPFLVNCFHTKADRLLQKKLYSSNQLGLSSQDVLGNKLENKSVKNEDSPCLCLEEPCGKIF